MTTRPTELVGIKIKEEPFDFNDLNLTRVNVFSEGCFENYSTNFGASSAIKHEQNEITYHASTSNTTEQRFSITIKKELSDSRKYDESYNCVSTIINTSSIKLENAGKDKIGKSDVDNTIVKNEAGGYLVDSCNAIVRFQDFNQTPIPENKLARNQQYSDHYDIDNPEEDQSYTRELKCEHRGRSDKLKARQSHSRYKRLLRCSTFRNYQNKVHQNLKWYKCVNCGKSYRSKQDLEQHKKLRHTWEKNQKCPHCNKFFKLKISLQDHQKAVHHVLGQGRRFESEERFYDKSQFREEQVSHPTYSYKCHNLNLGFGDKNVSLNHKADIHYDQYYSEYELEYYNEHYKAKPFKCSWCKKRFRANEDLNKHQSSKHLQFKSHKCSLCNDFFTHRSHLRHHQETVHYKPEQYNCPNCRKSFLKKIYLKQHQKAVHLNNKPYKSSEVKRYMAEKWSKYYDSK